MKLSYFFSRLLAVCVITAMTSATSLAKKDEGGHGKEDNRPPIGVGSDDGGQNRGGHHANSAIPGAGLNPNFGYKPKKFKFKLPTTVRGSSAKIEFKSKPSRQEFVAEVKLPILPDTSPNIPDLAAAEDTNVTLDLYHAGGVIPYASCNLDLYAIKFRSSVRKAEYAVKVVRSSRNGSVSIMPREGFCFHPDSPATAIIPDLKLDDEAMVTVGRQTFTVERQTLVSQSPISYFRSIH